jgi:hypothetical protein
MFGKLKALPAPTQRAIEPTVIDETAVVGQK